GFEWYSKLLKRWYNIEVYSPEEGYLSTVYTDISSRIPDSKLKQSKIKESEEKQNFLNQFYKKLFTQNALGVIYQFQYFPDGRNCFPYASENIWDVYEVTPEEVKTDSAIILNRLHPEDYDSVIESILKSFETLEIWDYEFRVNLPKKGLRWLRGIAKPEKLDDGSVVWNGYMSDITEKKCADLELQKSELRLKSIIEGTQVATWEWNIQTHETVFNERWAEIIGYTLEELSPVSIETWIKYTHPDDLKNSNEHLEKHFSGEIDYYEFESRMKHKDGSWIWILDRGKVVSWDNEGKPLRMTGTHSDISKRKKAEALLIQTRENYEMFFNSIDHFLFVLDEAGNMIHVNNTVINRLGYSWDELDGNSVLMVHPPERREEAGRIVGEMLAGTADFCPVPLLTKSGKQVPVETKVTKGIWDGKPVIFGVANDMAKIQLSEEKFSKVFYLNPSACGISDLETGQYLEVNDAFYSLLGFNKNEVIGKSALELNILTKESHENIMSNSNSKGGVFEAEAELRAKNGEIKQVLLYAENINVQDKKLRYTVVYDVTEKAIASKKIKENEVRFKALFDSSLLPTFLTEKGICTGQNYAAEQLFGYTTEEAIGKNISYLMADESKELINKNSFSNMTLRYEAIAQDKNGRKIPVEIQGKTIELDGKSIRITSLDDISEKKLAQEAISNYINDIKVAHDTMEQTANELFELNSKLEESEKSLLESNANKDKFFSIISHDLKSPFSGILGLTEMLVSDYVELTSDEIKEMIQLLRKSSVNFFEFLEDLLEWARTQTDRMDYEFRIMDFYKTSIKTIDLLKTNAQNKNIFLKNDVKENSIVYADEKATETVLRNLITNAIKFTQPNGIIKVKTEDRDNEIAISVTDSGIGMSEEDKNKLFKIEVHHTSVGTYNEVGTGLGLILCKELVEKLGGKIWVESEIGKGSKFIFTLPKMLS
ncbi:MAG: PAS domain S-box protein, partial [Melioribacteraceae bacterium]|nr:PAS domain S-box protein [Melioribacteraceae bacterium]